jgi:hypothetical protein
LTPLWHVHLSFYRRWGDDTGASAQNIAAVITGGAAPSGGGDDMGTFKTTVCKDTQTLTNSWKTLAMDGDGNQSWVWGPCLFQAQAQVVVNGLTGSSSARFRWVTVDVRQSDNWTKSGNPNVWPEMEVGITSGATYGQVAQWGQIGKPDSGYSRRLRLQGYADQAAGVSVSYLRCNLLSQ